MLNPDQTLASKYANNRDIKDFIFKTASIEHNYIENPDSVVYHTSAENTYNESIHELGFHLETPDNRPYSNPLEKR